MKVSLYTLALPNEQAPILEQHTFDTENDEDMDDLGGYYPENGLEEGDELSEEDLEAVARSFLYEDTVMEYQQRFVTCIVLTQSQLEAVNKVSQKYIAS
jgi:hypothetical protein